MADLEKKLNDKGLTLSPLAVSSLSNLYTVQLETFIYQE